MENPIPSRPKLPRDAAEVASISDINTARMALRWALERLHNFEKETSALKERAETESKVRRAAVDDLQALQRTFNFYAAKLQDAELKAAGAEKRLEEGLAEAKRAEVERAAPAPAEGGRAAPDGGRVAPARFEAQIAALKEEHQAELDTQRRKLEEAGAEALRKVQILADIQRTDLKAQLALERQGNEAETAALERELRGLLDQVKAECLSKLSSQYPDLKAQLEELAARAGSAEQERRRVTAEAEEGRSALRAEMAEQRRVYEARLEAALRDHRASLDEIRKDFEERLSSEASLHESERDVLRQEYEARLEAFRRGPSSGSPS